MGKMEVYILTEIETVFSALLGGTLSGKVKHEAVDKK